MDNIIGIPAVYFEPCFPDDEITRRQIERCIADNDAAKAEAQRRLMDGFRRTVEQLTKKLAALGSPPLNDLARACVMPPPNWIDFLARLGARETEIGRRAIEIAVDED